MSWADDNQPRYTIANSPTVRVLDRAYNHAIVREWSNGTMAARTAHAIALASLLNALDQAEDKAA